MPDLPNSHQALLRNQERLVGHLAILGLSDPGLLDFLPGSGLAMSEHAGIHSQLQARPPWVAAFGYEDPALSAGLADTVVIFVPKSRAELSLRLSLALWLVRPDGRLLLVGEKREGVAGAVRLMAEQLPQCEKVDSARHCQVWLADRVAPTGVFRLADWFRWHRVVRQGVGLDIAGLPGIFSDGELDAGTAMLLDTLAESPLKPGAVLDFACGAGVIGAWLQRYQSSQSLPVNKVDGIDVQSQAVICARETYGRAGVDGHIRASDGLERVEGRYQSVVTNPPFHTGVRTDASVAQAFLKDVSQHLVPGGELRVVANRFLPYEGEIRQAVGAPSVLAEDKRFIVWSATKR